MEDHGRPEKCTEMLRFNSAFLDSSGNTSDSLMEENPGTYFQ